MVPQAQPSGADLDRMRGAVGTLRVPAYWFQLEPRPGHYELESLDRIVGPAAERGIRVLPFVYGSPPWLEPGEARPPLDSARARRAWGALLRRLVGRYGPRGDFWRGRERPLPIRRWQIWNEPNFLLFWRPHPSPPAYARLLSISARAIRGADPGARVLTAGVAPVEAGMLPWAFLAGVYRTPGARRFFDAVALHPYGITIAATAYQVRRARRVMARNGDRAKPLEITELGVASDGQYPNGFDKGRRGQARYLRRVYGLLFERRRRWRIAGVDWFTWQDAPGSDPHCVFCQYAGLLDSRGEPKPAWWAFRRLAAAAAPSSVR